MLPCCIDGLCIGKLSENVRNRPHEVFLNDLMFILCQECKVPWQPPCECIYEIHPKSPLCLDIRNYVLNSYKRMHAKAEVAWFDNIRKLEEEKEKTRIENEINRMTVDSFSNDYWKKPGKIIKACDDTQLNKSPFDQINKGGISDRIMIRASSKDLRKRRSRIFNFLIHQDMYDAFMEILETALSCIVLYELGVTDAVFSGITAMVEVFEEYFEKTGRSFESILDRMYRLTTKLPYDNWPSDMIDNLHEVFTCDLLYFMCSMCSLTWYPPKSKEHKIKTKSPLTLDIQNYIEKCLPDAAEVYYKLYNKYFKQRAILAAFSCGLPAIMDEISVANIPQEKSVEDLLLLVLNTTRLSIELHLRRLCGGINEVYQQLPDALNKCNKRNKGRIFDLFNAFAKLENEKKGIRKAKSLDVHYFIHLWLF